MKIGIDLGGSHIATGLVDNESVIKKCEYNFSSEEKENMEQTLHRVVNEQIDTVLKCCSMDKIEKIGVSLPRKT